jgi:hypothetical protein
MANVLINEECNSPVRFGTVKPGTLVRLQESTYSTIYMVTDIKDRHGSEPVSIMSLTSGRVFWKGTECKAFVLPPYLTVTLVNRQTSS